MSEPAVVEIPRDEQGRLDWTNFGPKFRERVTADEQKLLQPTQQGTAGGDSTGSPPPPTTTATPHTGGEQVQKQPQTPEGANPGDGTQQPQSSSAIDPIGLQGIPIQVVTGSSRPAETDPEEDRDLQPSSTPPGT